MSRKPNILLIFTDQQRWDTIAAGGNPYVRTPNLDRLAREGVRFDAAYSPCPVCVPARCSMIYGQHPGNTGCFENNFSMPEDGRRSMMSALTGAGYRTHGIGKMHFTPDPHAMRGLESRETQEELVDDASRDDYLCYLRKQGCEYAIEPYGVRGAAYYVPQLSPVPPQHHPTQWVGDRTVKWLEENAGKDRPFFLFSSYIHPHPPFSPPTPWHKIHRGPDMPLPNLPPDMEKLTTYTNRIQNRYKGRDTGRDTALVRLIKAYYWASISFIDAQVGRTLEVLERKGELDDTLIVFTSDHGEFLGDYNCFGKRSFLDPAARVPMLCRYPARFDTGAVCRRPVSLIDLMPTFLAAAGSDAEAMDGVDLAEIASGAGDREWVFGQYQDARAGIYMAVSERWKYIYSAPDDREFLFDRVRDPRETRNRAYNIVCADIVLDARARLQRHLRALPGGEKIVGDDGWIAKEPVELADDPDAGLIVQDPPCFKGRIRIPGYLDSVPEEPESAGADFDPLRD
ncbi:sulfatase [Kiritimatiella glycovorans]|uniref:Arylsulfatase n=1 Tax=Kiritimatiella glycovorans TaxID=1307763 RepID=A0A0G3EJE3_9BACT|nr:sulfatase-like hydrolase/transferase [Kiritimatiella glycovorans]AKJ65557.1 Arylsulfatase [Kiritimatiella glycovorans]